MRLLQERFNELPDQVQRLVHSAIIDGLPPALLPPNQDPKEANERLSWRLLNVLREEVLTDLERKKKEDLFTRHGKSEQPLFLSWTSGVLSAKPPATAEQLQQILDQGGLDRLFEVLRSPSDYFQVDWMDSTDLLWAELGTLVEKNPEYFLDAADMLETSDFPAAWRYFNSYEQLSESGTDFDWKPLLGAMKRLAGSPNTDRSIANLIKQAAWGSTNPVALPEIDLVIEIAVDILTRTFTPLDQVYSIDHDLTSHQLNSPAGGAADAIVGVIYKQVLDKSTEEERITIILERKLMTPEMDSLLERMLDEGWGGVELRHSIGQRIRIIVWADSEWLNSKLDKLLPKSTEEASTSGAWCGLDPVWWTPDD